MVTRIKLQSIITLLTVSALIFLTGCTGGAYKSSGQYKRDILLDRIEKNRQCQDRGKNQFEVVLASYSNLVDASASASDLRGQYNKLYKEYKKAKAVAKALSKSLKAVESTGKPLFRGWEDELDEYENELIRRSSEKNLEITRGNYLKVVHAIKDTEGRTKRVLKLLSDQLLFLSQNLDARALTSFKKEITALKIEMGDLIKRMELAIGDIQEFRKTRSIDIIELHEQI